MRREFIGKGVEHTVYRSKAKTDWVLKRPNFLATLTLNFLRVGVSGLRQESKALKEKYKEGTLRYPPTRIFKKGYGYIYGQEFIEEDNSIEDKFEYLHSFGMENEAIEYRARKENFIGNRGILYVIESEKWYLRRILEAVGIDYENYRNFLRGLKRIKKSLN